MMWPNKGIPGILMRAQKPMMPKETMSPEKITIAAFDFDGTLTDRDSLPQFLYFACGKFKTYWTLFRCLPVLFLTAIGLSSRQQAKEAIITKLFKGRPKSDLCQAGAAFASGPLNNCIRKEIKEKLIEHKKQNHYCVLISANLDVYLQPWGMSAGFDKVISSKIAVDNDGNITGKLEGPNCWGPEKVRRLVESLRLSRESYTLWVYGDSRGDEALLAFADFPIRISRSGP